MATKQKIKVTTMKKMSKILLALAFSFTLIACNKQDKPINEEPASNDLFIGRIPPGKKPGHAIDPSYDEPGYVIYNGRKHTVIRPYIFRDIETGEEIDLRKQ